MNWEVIGQEIENANIKVVGVGGAGGNAVKHMIENNIEGVDTSADYLRIARIALTYLTTDGSKGGFYDLNERTFLKSSGSIKRATEDGLKIAAKQAPPALIQIPIYKD